MKFFGQISKVQAEDDGTIKVYGIASTDNVDDTGETITADCMKAALGAYLTWGAVREMHGPSAAGTAISASVNDAGQLEFAAHIVDPIAVKKVQTGVYKGFSVGGKCTARDPLNKSIITGMNLTEVSLVDRPANPEAVINVWKALEMNTPESTPIAAVVVAPEVVSEDVKKASMYSVSRFAELLSSLANFANYSEFEESCAEAGTTIPDDLKAWVIAGVEIFANVSAEASATMLEQMQATTAKAAGTVGNDIEKAGAKFSKAAKATLGEVHKMLKSCDDAMSKMGYDSEKDDEELDAEEDAKKALVGGDIAKAFEIEKSDAVAKALAPVVAELSIAKARVTELEAMPAPAKAVLTVVEKSAAVDVVEVAPVTAADGSVNATATAIKKAMQAGGFRLA